MQNPAQRCGIDSALEVDTCFCPARVSLCAIVVADAPAFNGLACIHVWGFDDERALNAAAKCGVALQLTNILRDIAEDARAGRIYLPQQELDQFNYSAQELQQGVVDGAENNAPTFYRLRHYEAARFYSLDEHTFVPDVLLMSKRIWDGLTATEKQ